MIRSLHISAPTNKTQNLYLFDFATDVYFNHITEPYPNKISDMLTRDGADIIVDSDAVVDVLNAAGFLVLDLGKVSV